MADLSHLGGWLGIDEIQQAAAQEFPTMSQAAPRLVGEAPAQTDPILLYKAWRTVLGKDPAYVAQTTGDCTSQGGGHGNDLLQCVEISLGEASEYRETDTEFIYGTAREIAGILGRGAGCYGSAIVKAMQTVGVVSREMLGADGVYSGKRADAWGRTGVPAAIKEKAATYKLGSAALVSTWDELVAALGNGYPVIVCSSQGFSLHRDQDGFCAAQGIWQHCMLLSGVRVDRPGACVLQSWGPDCPDGPTALEQPSFSFWAERRIIERMLAAGDSWALSKAADFVKRALPASWNNSGWL